MGDPALTSLLERLAGKGSDGTDPWAALAATEPDHGKRPAKTAPGALPPRVEGISTRDETLDRLLQQIHSGADLAIAPAAEDTSEFRPLEPLSFDEAQLTGSEVEALILKYLLARGDSSGRDTADHIRLPFLLIEDLMRQMKHDHLLVHRGAAPMNDYVYQLTDMGRERARRHTSYCTYFGAA